VLEGTVIIWKILSSKSLLGKLDPVGVTAASKNTISPSSKPWPVVPVVTVTDLLLRLVAKVEAKLIAIPLAAVSKGVMSKNY